MASLFDEQDNAFRVKDPATGEWTLWSLNRLLTYSKTAPLVADPTTGKMQTLPLTIDTQWYMTDGPGRYYTPSEFPGRSGAGAVRVQETVNPLDYIASYSDLMTAYGTNGAEAQYHFDHAGAYEARFSTFNGLEYIAAHADLIAAARGGGFGPDAAAWHIAGAQHWIEHRVTEPGRHVSFDGWSYKADFDGLAYIASWTADVGTAVPAATDGPAPNLKRPASKMMSPVAAMRRARGTATGKAVRDPRRSPANNRRAVICNRAARRFRPRNCRNSLVTLRLLHRPPEQSQSA